MAVAKKCDRCGKYYDGNKFCDDARHLVGGICFLRHNGYYSFPVDLCDECLFDLRQFLNGRELEVEEDEWEEEDDD